MPVSFLEALMGMHVDTSGLEEGLKKAEAAAEQSTKKIAGNFGLMATGIATAIAGTIVAALEMSIKKTAEYGLEMEHLGARMGMTAQQAAVLSGVFERQGVNVNTAARAMQMMAMQVKQTQQSLDPFQTRMGQLLGTLRDTSGHALNMGQVLDLARQKIGAAATETDKLQTAQALFGTRIGGQVLPVLKLSNEEWDKQKASVEKSIGPVQQAADAALQYKQASAALEQSFRGIELEIGTKLLPTLSQWILDMQNGLTTIKDWIESSKALSTVFGAVKDAFTLKPVRDGAEAATSAILFGLEKIGVVAKGTTENFANMAKYQKDAADASTEAAKKKEEEAAAQQALTDEINETEKVENQLVSIASKRVDIAEKLLAAGKGTQGDVDLAVQEKLLELAKQRASLEEDLAKAPTTDQRLEVEEKLQQNKLANLDTLAKQAASMFKDEEAELRAQGALNLGNEIELLQKRLGDENILKNERLKIEGDLAEKRKQYAEELVSISTKLGLMSVDQEISYRKQKAAELLGKGDVVGASQEVLKARDLSLQQFDKQVEFVKKLHTVSIQSEIEFQKQKLEVVKGNAEQEMQVISQIADLDKQLYDRRLQFALTYTQNTIDAYRKMQQATGQDASAVSGSKESLTFAQAANEAERARFQNARDITDVAAHGGTEEARNTAVQQAQAGLKQFEEMVQLGKELTDGMKSQRDAFTDLLKAASGGEEVRAPGGPSPTVGSITSSIEGLATQGLNRSTAVPQLDTSFTDLATRLRDVLNTNVSNLINFGQAVGDAAKKISAITGVPLNPGASGPGGGIVSAGSPQQSPQFGGGTSTVAPPTVGPGSIPTTATPQVGVGGTGGSGGTGTDALVKAIQDLGSTMDKQTEAITAAQQNSAAQIDEAIARIQASRAQVAVTVGVDPNSGDILTTSKLLDQL